MRMPHHLQPSPVAAAAAPAYLEVPYLGDVRGGATLLHINNSCRQDPAAAVDEAVALQWRVWLDNRIALPTS